MSDEPKEDAVSRYIRDPSLPTPFPKPIMDALVRNRIKLRARGIKTIEEFIEDVCHGDEPERNENG